MLKAFLEKYGIELGEEFMIGKSHYRVDKDIEGNYCLMYRYTKYEWCPATLTVNNLEQAETEITKLTWKYGDIYHVPDLFLNTIKSFEYRDDNIDHNCYSMGLLCRTLEEAQEKLKKIQDFCKKEFT